MSTLGTTSTTILLLAAITALTGAPEALAAIDDPHVHMPGEPWPDLVHEANLPLGEGAGIWVDGAYAYVTAKSDGFKIVNVSDPAAPQVVSTLGGVVPRDVDLLDQGATRIAVLAEDNSAQGRWLMHLVDVTDPAAPRLLSSLALPDEPHDTPFHNVAVVRGHDLVYNARSEADGMDIIDVSDPSNPYRVKVWTASVWTGTFTAHVDCHDVTLFPEANRAYCAGGQTTWILDITDPLEPRVEGTITNTVLSLHHWAIPSPEHDLLLIGDEAPAGGGCYGGPNATPKGALWIYDIRDPASPQLKSWVEAPEMATAASDRCTAHFGGLVNDHTVAVGWYAAGVLLIDFEDPAFPVIAEQWTPADADAWDVRHAGGYLVTGDGTRGLDVLRIVCGPAGC